MINLFVSLGSNMQNPRWRLAAAMKAMTALPDVHLSAASPVYNTEPQNRKDQPWFYNQVAHLTCGPQWSAQAMLESLLAIEVALGRQNTGKERFGPRCIDLDLLLFGDELCDTESLRLPHPRMFERAFVLAPLLDIAPELVFPDGRSPRSCLAALTYRVQSARIYQ